MDYTDIRYEVADRIATITIDREKRLNAFRGRTVEELLHAFRAAWADDDVGAVIFTGAGNKAFCVGGDQKEFVETGSWPEPERALGDRGPARRHPLHSQAGHCRGERIRHRWRQRAGSGVRRGDCRRARPFRTGWAARRIVRCRLGHPSHPAHRRAQGTRDVVLLSPVHGDGGGALGPCQQGGAGGQPDGRSHSLGAGDCRTQPDGIEIS